MALVICPECQHQVSEYAASCPHCGYSSNTPISDSEENARTEVIQKTSSRSAQKSTRDSIFKVLGLLVVGFVGAAFFASFKTPPSNPQQFQPSTEATPQVQVMGKIGDMARVGHFEFKVDDFKFLKSLGDGQYSKKADGVFLLIKLSIENKDKETRTLDSSMFRLINSKDSVYESSVEGTTAYEMAGYEYGSIFLKGCQPNIKTVGVLVFEVPSKQDKYRLQLSGGYGTGEHGVIALSR